MAHKGSPFSVPFSIFGRNCHKEIVHERPKLEEFISTSFSESKSYSGLVTSLNQGEGVVNNEIFFTIGENSSFNFKVGDHVQGEAIKQNEYMAWRAITIYPDHNENWDEEKEKEISSLSISNNVEIPTIISGKVLSIFNKNLIALDTSISFYINEQNCSFQVSIGKSTFILN